MNQIVLEIRAGVGGEEAALWGADLLRMYGSYAQKQGWSFDIVDVSWRGKGIREATIIVKGKGVAALVNEAGIHRIQRVSVTEKRGRVHTSAASVAVLPVEQGKTITIPDKDVRTDVFRSTGKGGQGVNKTESAVRVTHIPTGTVATCQDERSQIVNRERAMIVLVARLQAVNDASAGGARRDERREQIGMADRSEKRRTYDMPEDTVFDHRSGKSVRRVKKVLDGDLSALLAA